MLYANIIVDISHEKLDKTFQYIIPDGMEKNIHAGSMVNIPFGKGNRVITGYVLEVTSRPEYEISKLKKIISIVDKSIPIEGRLIKLADFIKINYGSTMNQSLKTVVPVKIQTKKIEKRDLLLKISKEEVGGYISEFKKKNAKAKLRLIESLVKYNKISYEKVTKELNIQVKTINEFEELGIIQIISQRMYRDPVNYGENGGYDIILTEKQKKIADDIWESDKKIHLIHGITGSGKTEIYIELIKRTIDENKQVIVLIPEIALTYQTVMRFKKKFGERVAIMNSRLSQGEKSDQIEMAKKGLVDIIIGPRSAIFTPFERLGLIIIDEEHEGAYKSENVPKYHAREVGIFRTQENDGKIILGSATPSIDSYYKAEKGEYQLHEIMERPETSILPEVEVVDLREELEKGNRTVISGRLNELIIDRLKKKQQIMLFINRRGYAGFVSCRSCGKVMKCPHCDVSLTYHNNDTLVCHYCNHTVAMPKTCPECKSKYIATFGTGTQKIEEMVKKMYPGARVARMDMDTTSKKGDHERILSSFSKNETDILVGTQMIVKGHDFKNVTLVGVIAADLSLYASDYRAAERTFQLLTQSAGRAGRGKEKGNVVIQTYTPENFAVEAASMQDYKEFYEKEILYRQLMEYPPVVSMFALLVTCENKDVLREFTSNLKINIENMVEKDQNRYKKTRLIGPAPAGISRIKDIYREVFYIKNPEKNKIIEIKDFIEEYYNVGCFKNKVTIQFDLDPLNGC